MARKGNGMGWGGPPQGKSSHGDGCPCQWCGGGFKSGPANPNWKGGVSRQPQETTPIHATWETAEPTKEDALASGITSGDVPAPSPRPAPNLPPLPERRENAAEQVSPRAWVSQRSRGSGSRSLTAGLDQERF